MGKTIEYRVRPVIRYVVTRYENGDSAVAGRSSQFGEFDSFKIALVAAYAMCRDEHSRLGWPANDERIKYPEHHLDSDWARVDALTDQDIEAAIASDPDAAQALDAQWFDEATVLSPSDHVKTAPLA